MSDALFVDTSGWTAFFDVDDPDHTAVAAIVAESIRQHRTLVTTDHHFEQAGFVRMLRSHP